MKALVDRRTKQVKWVEDSEADQMLQSDPNFVDLDKFEEPSQTRQAPVPTLTPRSANIPTGKPDLPNAFDTGQQGGGLIKTDQPGRRLANMMARMPANLGVVAGSAEAGPLGLIGGIPYALWDTASTWNEDPSNANIAGNAFQSLAQLPAMGASRAASKLPMIGRIIANGAIGSALGEGTHAVKKAFNPDEPTPDPLTRIAEFMIPASVGALPANMSPEAKIRETLNKTYGPKFQPKNAAEMRPGLNVQELLEEYRDPNLKARIKVKADIDALRGEQQQLAEKVAGRKMQKGQDLATNRTQQANLRKDIIGVAADKEKLPRNQNLPQRAALIDRQAELKRQLEDVNRDRFFKSSGFHDDGPLNVDDRIDKPADYAQVTAPQETEDLSARIDSVHPTYTPEQQAIIDRNEAILADPKKPAYAKERARGILDKLYGQQDAAPQAPANSDDEFAQAIQDAIARRSAQKEHGIPAEPGAAPEEMPTALTPEAQMTLNRGKMAGLKSQYADLYAKGKQIVEPNFPENMDFGSREAYKNLFNGADTPEKLVNNLYKSDPTTVAAFARMHGNEKTGSTMAAEFMNRSFNPEKGDLSLGPKEWAENNLGTKLKAAFGDSPEGKEAFAHFHELYNSLQDIATKTAKENHANKFVRFVTGAGSPGVVFYISNHYLHNPMEAAGITAGYTAAQFSVNKLVSLANEHPELIRFLTNFAKGPATAVSLAEAPRASRDVKAVMQLLSNNADSTGTIAKPSQAEQDEMRRKGYLSQ